MVASVVALAVGGLAGFVVATESRGAGKAGTTPPTTVIQTTSPTASGTTATTMRPAATQAETTAASTSTTQRPPTTARAASESALRRRDARPEGVQSFMSAFGGGAGGADPCTEVGDWSGPTVAVPGSSATNPSQGVVRVGEPGLICLLGFEPMANLEVRVTEPTRRVWEYQVCYLCGQPPDEPPKEGDIRADWIPWDSVPGDALGRYQVVVTQDSATKATGSFRLERQPAPMLRVLESWGQLAVPRLTGTTVHVILAGFRPRSTVRLHLYHTAASSPYETSHYITTVPVRTDANGERLYPLPTRPDDPEGCYVVDPQPTVNFAKLRHETGGGMAFCLT